MNIAVDALSNRLTVHAATVPINVKYFRRAAMIYQRFLNMILGLRANMNPDSISCDYAIALFNTVSAGFPNAEIFGCFFPFCEEL